jgi:hypothetical protein
LELATLVNRTVVCRARGVLRVRAIRILLAGAVLVCVATPATSVQAASKSKHKREAKAPKKEAKAPKKDKREVKAREAFAEGRYQEAAELFAKLYAEKRHPTYLRNIGRCYQNLKDPDKAINAFRDYLREGKDISFSEKTEVEGYVAEMESLKKKQEEPRSLPPPPPPPMVLIPPAAPPVQASQESTSAVLSLTEQPAPVAPEASEPFYKRGWFWGVVGVAVAAGVVGGLYAGGVFTPAGQCPSGTTCKALGGSQ